MKKTILSMSIGILLIVGCSTENADTQIEPQNAELINVHRFDGENLVWETISLDEMKSNQNKSGTTIPLAKRGNSVHAHGNFHGFGGTFSFSGSQNNGGAHGSAEIEIVSPGGGPFGPPGGSAHLILETANLVIGNVQGEDAALYVGRVTEVIENTYVSLGSCQKYGLGTYVYFLVKDNGQGKNAPTDQFRSAIITSCDEPSESIINAYFIFYNLSFFSSWLDVEEASDKIKVNY